MPLWWSNAGERLTAEQALLHPWIISNETVECTPDELSEERSVQSGGVAEREQIIDQKEKKCRGTTEEWEKYLI